MTIENLSITGGYDGIYGDSGSSSTGLTVSNSTIYGNAVAGVDLETSDYDVTFTGDTVTGGSYGLYLDNVNDVTVSGNTVGYASSDGIYVGGSRDMIEDNTVYENSTGIYASGGNSTSPPT